MKKQSKLVLKRETIRTMNLSEKDLKQARGGLMPIEPEHTWKISGHPAYCCN